jgi:hypothetical protein
MIVKPITNKSSQMLQFAVIFILIVCITAQTADDDEVLIGIPGYTHRIFSGTISLIQDIWILASYKIRKAFIMFSFSLKMT